MKSACVMIDSEVALHFEVGFSTRSVICSTLWLDSHLHQNSVRACTCTQDGGDCVKQALSDQRICFARALTRVQSERPSARKMEVISCTSFPIQHMSLTCAGVKAQDEAACNAVSVCVCRLSIAYITAALRQRLLAAEEEMCDGSDGICIVNES